MFGAPHLVCPANHLPTLRVDEVVEDETLVQVGFEEDDSAIATQGLKCSHVTQVTT